MSSVTPPPLAPKVQTIVIPGPREEEIAPPHPRPHLRHQLRGAHQAFQENLCAKEQALVERALLGRRHADRGVASMKRFVPKDEANKPPKGGGCNIEHDFHGEKSANETHVSTAHPDARLFRGVWAGGQALPPWGIQTCWLEWRPAWMGRPYSQNLQERVVTAVLNGGMSWRKAASHFAGGISAVINWVRRFGETGCIAPRVSRSATSVRPSNARSRHHYQCSATPRENRERAARRYNTAPPR